MKQEIYRRGHWRIRSEEKNIHRRRGLLPEPARGAWFFLIRFDASGGQRGVGGFSERCRTTSKNRTITRVRRAESAPNRRLENAEWRGSDPRKKSYANNFLLIPRVLQGTLLSLLCCFSPPSVFSGP